MATIDQFFVVINADDDSRLYRHLSQESAVKEAKRLGKNFPDKTFVVFAPVDAYRKASVDQVVITKPSVNECSSHCCYG